MRDADSEKMTLRLPPRYLKALDFLVEVDDFPSRSEAVRAAIRDFVYARVELVVRIRHFVWLSTRMFSAAAFAFAFLGYLWTETFANAASNFLASIVSGAMFGLSSFLKFGPTDA